MSQYRVTFKDGGSIIVNASDAEQAKREAARLYRDLRGSPRVPQDATKGVFVRPGEEANT